MSDFLRQFAHTFATLDKHNLHLLGRLYSEDVAFADPLHEVQGLPALQRYFADLYSNVSELNFDFHGFDTVAEGEGYLRWAMRFRHPRLAGGQVIEVPGCSHLMWHDKVYRHRDYFDAGALLYEHVPLLGRVIRWLKRRMG
ncbi:nuclear transport factor 2 family protein [Pseudomonas sp. RTS1]|uniref:nuclear transport factor 2 family protein n=1 Tax=unclassified Pseudomonas TaxID=196821 RepID=UPI002B238BEB|nr:MULTISPECIES: nuclear transport factor 2 family protein [unclassified Pseudomonas]MEA9990312.1 nuclear transport factor 2 family protein [Pseudomonas sp. RTS1]MEB0035882.1 nuclear transport factor 2 family protein [Pseudomonas sp. RTS2]MEB0238633.1 nuclear transport factor 2 family protein [Pseudomonas sp. 5S3]MEB0255556.1 nuclear transport factor 2 family protein [Pseudomonas sp. 5S2]